MDSKSCSVQDPNFLKLKPMVNCYVNTQACDQDINETFEKINVITVYFVTVYSTIYTIYNTQYIHRICVFI